MSKLPVGGVPKRCLLIVRLGGTPQRAQIAAAGKAVEAAIARFVKDKRDYQFAFTSSDATCFGFLVRTPLNPAIIRNRIHTPTREPDRMSDDWSDYMPSPLTGNDSVMVLELGDDFAASRDGFGKATNWLKHK